MNKPIQYHNLRNTKFDTSVDRYPDKCPMCKTGISPHWFYAFSDSKPSDYHIVLQVMFRCPIEECQGLFIAYYKKDHGSFDSKLLRLQGSELPLFREPVGLSSEIRAVSEEFFLIYRQAHTAENGGLNKICGPGYRKALEFLIKDYLIKKYPEEEKTIARAPLGPLIQDRIDDSRIKDCATRAAWLGNDEAHYVRKWESSDINDVKTLIKLTVIWIESLILTQQYKQNMPGKSDK